MTKEEVYNIVANKWRDNKGIGSIYAISPINSYELAVYIIKLMRNKNSNCKVFVLCYQYENYNVIRQYLNQSGLLESVVVVTTKYINPMYKYHYDICIAIGFSVLLANDVSIIEQSKFRFVILDRKVNDKQITKGINSHFPIIENVITNSEANVVRSNTPVEEWRIPVTLDAEDFVKYEQYSDYIAQTIKIFGNFDRINQARVGDKQLNIGKETICDYIARENGWNEYLDCTSEFNKQIDEMYNPASIALRAETAYNIMRERSNMLTDAKCKLPAILDIVRKNADKRIIIVSKRGEFANAVYNYLKENGVAVGEYHDAIPPRQAIDVNGKPILVKSGINKGKPRIVKAQFISNDNLRLFNLCGVIPYRPNSRLVEQAIQSGGINVLSIKNASSDELKCTSDVFIFTSAMYADWNEFKYRFNKVSLGEIPTNIYKIYAENTIEEKAFDKVKESNNYHVHGAEKEITFDENIGAVLL